MKESIFQGLWHNFKGLRGDKNRLLPRFVRRAKLRIRAKGR